MNTQIDQFWKLLPEPYLRQLKICISDSIKTQIFDLLPIHEKSCSYVNPETILMEKHIPLTISKLLRVDHDVHAFIKEFTKWYVSFFFGLIKAEIKTLIEKRANTTKALEICLNIVKVNKITNEYDVTPCFSYNEILTEYARFKQYSSEDRFMITGNSLFLVNLESFDYRKIANLSSMVKSLNFGSKFFRILTNSQLIDYLEKRNRKSLKRQKLILVEH